MGIMSRGEQRRAKSVALECKEIVEADEELVEQSPALVSRRRGCRAWRLSEVDGTDYLR